MRNETDPGETEMDGRLDMNEKKRGPHSKDN
jgi:hypothetical protein